ncbi:MAG: kelch repeat-containing protein [Cyanobacteria bacterium P01_F01_bin.53]
MGPLTKALENWTLPHRLWQTKSPLPTPVLESMAAVLNGELYVFGGFTLKWQAVTDAYKYNLQADQWVALSPMPTPVTHVNSAIDHAKIWIAGGFVGNHPGAVTDEVWCYNTVADQWTACTPLPEKRAGGGLAILNQELHYFGGFSEDRNTTHANHWVLPLEGGTQWVETTPLPVPRGHVAAIVVQDKIYAMGGQIGHDIDPVDYANNYCFDPTNNTWSELKRMPEPRSHFEAGICAVENYILVTGGRNNQCPVLITQDLWDHRNDKLIDDFPLQLRLRLKSSNRTTDVLSNILVYDIEQNSWREIASLPTRLYGPVAAMVNKCFIVTGGGRTRHRNVQTRTLLNESLIDLIGATPS